MKHLDTCRIMQLIGGHQRTDGFGYNGHCMTHYCCTTLNYFSLEFWTFETKWIYGYHLYNRQNCFPMYLVKDNKCCVITNEQKLKEAGEKIRNNTINEWLNKTITTIKVPYDKQKLDIIIKENQKILFEERTTFDEENTYLTILV